MQPIKELTEYIKEARILLIDDSEPFQRLTSEMLKKLGVASVDVSSSLSEGMQRLNYNKNDPSVPPDYDLVMMDVNLPDGNGMEGCQFITAHTATYNIPVIVVTGTSTPSLIHEAFEAGASDYMQKPLNADLLTIRLGVLLKLRMMGFIGEDISLRGGNCDNRVFML